MTPKSTPLSDARGDDGWVLEGGRRRRRRVDASEGEAGEGDQVSDDVGEVADEGFSDDQVDESARGGEREVHVSDHV